MNKTEAYKIVFEDLKKCELFTGKYDARHGSEKYMHGIATVMEVIALGVSEDVHDEFDIMFINNMIESERKETENE